MLVLLSLLDTNGIDIRTNDGFNPSLKAITHYIIFYPRAVCAILVINYIGALLPQQYLQISILTYIGKNSMSFYVMHMPIMILCKLILWHTPGIPSYFSAIIVLAVLIISLPILDYLFRRYWPEALGLKRNKKRMTTADELT